MCDCCVIFWLIDSNIINNINNSQYGNGEVTTTPKIIKHSQQKIETDTHKLLILLK